MAIYDTTRTTYGVASFVNRVSAYVADAAATIVAWNDVRVTRNALSGLSDRELEDIGLTRGDIEVVLQGDLIR